MPGPQGRGDLSCIVLCMFHLLDTNAYNCVDTFGLCRSVKLHDLSFLLCVHFDLYVHSD